MSVTTDPSFQQMLDYTTITAPNKLKLSVSILFYVEG